MGQRTSRARPESDRPEAVPRRRRRVKNGIFCIECTWWGRLNEPSSIRPMLELIGNGQDGAIPFVHRHADTREAFDDYVRRWAQRQYDAFPILYLGFHGEDGYLMVGDSRRTESRVYLKDLEGILAGRCAGRVIHFGACDGMSPHGRKLRGFAKRLGAVAVCGYRKDVDWIESAAFEALLFATLQGKKLTGTTFPARMRELDRLYSSLRKRVGFHYVRPSQ